MTNCDTRAAPANGDVSYPVLRRLDDKGNRSPTLQISSDEFTLVFLLFLLVR